VLLPRGSIRPLIIFSILLLNIIGDVEDKTSLGSVSIEAQAHEYPLSQTQYLLLSICMRASYGAGGVASTMCLAADLLLLLLLWMLEPMQSALLGWR